MYFLLFLIAVHQGTLQELVSHMGPGVGMVHQVIQQTILNECKNIICGPENIHEGSYKIHLGRGCYARDQHKGK